MKRVRNLCAAVAGFAVILGLGSIAQAGVGLTLKGGTTGAGGDLTFKLNDNLNLRAGVSAFNTTQDINEADADINLLNVPILLDWHPFKDSGFRVSGGVMFTDNYLKISDQNKTVTINDVDYAVTDIRGKIDFDNTVGPYIGIGWGNAVHASSHWYFSADLGVAYVGSPDVSLRATASDPLLQTELDNNIAEQIKTYKDDADQFQLYPVITIGLSYSF
ncbi:MAG: hypothetical protein WC081_01010 [Candidatus Ratteibacteria bacterium]